MERNFFPTDPTPLDTTTTVMVAIFLLFIIALLIVFAIRKYKEDKINRHFRLNHNWKNTSRFTILICAFLTIASTVSAVSADELLIVKQNKTVYYFDIKNYREINMYVISNVLVDPKASDLVILETPKEAWPIINQVGDGIFDTRINKLEEQLKAQKEKNKKLEDLNGSFGGIIIISIIMVVGLLLLSFILGKYWIEDHEKLKAFSKEVSKLAE